MNNFVQNYSNAKIKKSTNFNIISNNFNPIKEEKIVVQKEKVKDSYVESLKKNNNDHRAKKQLSFVSCLGNLDELELNKICLTDTNGQEDQYASEHRKKLEENAKGKFKNKNSTKIKKYIDQSSSIFANELYGSNLNSKFLIFYNFFLFFLQFF